MTTFCAFNSSPSSRSAISPVWLVLTTRMLPNHGDFIPIFSIQLLIGRPKDCQQIQQVSNEIRRMEVENELDQDRRWYKPYAKDSTGHQKGSDPRLKMWPRCRALNEIIHRKVPATNNVSPGLEVARPGSVQSEAGY